MSEDSPLVSIVTPSYNQGRFIEDTILSVKNQDYPNIEHIIVDGGSTDNTLEILIKYENQYNLRWISEPDDGQSDAVNRGFKIAKGEIVGWVNSDDVYFDVRVISCVVEKFKEVKHADVMYGDIVYIDEIGTVLKLVKSLNWDYKRLLRSNFIGQPATFFRRKVILENELDKNLHLAMDYEFWLRLGKNYNFIRVNKILAGFRFYQGTKSFSATEKQRLEGKDIMVKHGQDFGLRYRIGYFVDRLLFVYMSLKGTKDILELTNTEGLAFKARIPSKFTRIKSQMPLRGVWNLLRGVCRALIGGTLKRYKQ